MNRRQALSSGFQTFLGLAISKPLFQQINYNQFDCDCETDSKIRICCNENPYGPSPKARKAIEDNMKYGNRYPREILDELKKQIAAANGLTPDHVFLGAGSAAILQLTGLWVGLQKKDVISTDYTFRWLMKYAVDLGNQWVKVPLTKDKYFDLDGIKAKLNDNIGLIYLVNPNNPTGTYLPADQIHAFCKTVPSNYPIFLDEAYIEFIPGHENNNSAKLIKDHPNVMVCRTFSKLYGLAGLRVGYLLADPSMVEALDRLDIGFGMTISYTSAAAALASLEDSDFKQHSYKRNLVAREYLQSQLQRWNLNYHDATANFVHCDVTRFKNQIKSTLKEKNIALNPNQQGDQTFLRISIGTMQEMETFVQRMDGFFMT